MDANISVFVIYVKAIIYLSYIFDHIICMIKLSLEVKNDQGSKQEIIRNAKTSGDIVNFADSSLSLVKCCLNR